MSRTIKYNTTMTALLCLAAMCLAGCPRQGPDAAFTATPTSGQAPLTVQFNDQSDDNGSTIISWAWNFGDQSTSTQPSPTHTYTTPGTYTVSLTVTNDEGSDSVTRTDYITVQESQVTQFYVSPLGNDASAGTQAAPWRTIQFGVNNIEPGEVLNILPGNYSENIVIDDSGDAGDPITLQGSTTGTSALTGSITIAQGVSYVTVADITISGFTGAGVTLTGDNQFIDLRGLTINNGMSGIRMTQGVSGGTATSGGVSDVTIADCVIQNPELGGIRGVPGPCDSITVTGVEILGAGLAGAQPVESPGLIIETGDSIIVEDSFIHDNGGDGISLNLSDDAGEAPGIIVRRNVLNGNRRYGVHLYAGGRLVNNVLVNQGSSAVVLGDYPGTYEAFNNTLAFNMYTAAFAEQDYAFVAGPDVDGGEGVDLTLVNNIFAYNVGPAVGDPTGIYLGPGINLVTESNNLFWSSTTSEIVAEFVAREDSSFTRTEITNGTWAQESGEGADDIAADPQFVGVWPDVDPHLQATSPAADAGTSVGAPAVDIELTPRPQGAGYSIGAYEE